MLADESRFHDCNLSRRRKITVFIRKVNRGGTVFRRWVGSVYILVKTVSNNCSDTDPQNQFALMSVLVKMQQFIKMRNMIMRMDLILPGKIDCISGNE